MIKRDVGRLLALGARPTLKTPVVLRAYTLFHSRSRVSRSKTATRCIIRASAPEIRDTLRGFSVHRAWSQGNDHFSSSSLLPFSHLPRQSRDKTISEWTEAQALGGFNDVSTGIRTCLFFLLLLFSSTPSSSPPVDLGIRREPKEFYDIFIEDLRAAAAANFIAVNSCGEQGKWEWGSEYNGLYSGAHPRGLARAPRV